MRQGHKMRDGSKRAAKSARRTVRKISGKSKEPRFDVRGVDLDRIKDRLNRSVDRRFPKDERISLEEKSRKSRVERTPPPIPAGFYEGARKKSRAPRGFTPPTFRGSNSERRKRALAALRGQ